MHTGLTISTVVVDAGTICEIRCEAPDYRPENRSGGDKTFPLRPVIAAAGKR